MCFLFLPLPASVARLIKFYDIPLLTAGGFVYDYTEPKTEPDSQFYLLTRYILRNMQADKLNERSFAEPESRTNKSRSSSSNLWSSKFLFLALFWPFFGNWRVRPTQPLTVTSIRSMLWRRAVFMYHKEERKSWAGNGTCHLFMSTLQAMLHLSNSNNCPFS